ncbi:hypothetical protein HDU67_008256 [Dinochytrium kinnereticum]|nr:hypothetical protein HDU67_008256 [Dinochytrium kinnereticum]
MVQTVGSRGGTGKKHSAKGRGPDSPATTAQGQIYDIQHSHPGTSHSHGTSIISVVTPPKTAWLVPRKPATPKRLTEAQEEMQRLELTREEKLFEILMMSRHDSIALAKAIDHGLFEAGLDVPAPTERARYDPNIEDRIERDAALADILFNFASEAYRIGLSELYLSFWLTVIKATHESYIGHAKRGQISLNVKECKEIFDKTVSETSVSLSAKLAKFPATRFQQQKEYAMKRMMDCFSKTYLCHIKLITHVFLRPRKLELIKIVKDLETEFPMQPLAVGIPAEKWEEYLAAENEKARKQKEAELEAIEAKKREEEERQKKEREALAASLDPYRRIDGIITLHVPPIEPYTGPPPIFPTSESLFPSDFVSHLPESTSAEDSTFESKPIEPYLTSEDPTFKSNVENKNRPLTPHTITSVLSQTTVPYLASIHNYIESSLDHQANETLSRVSRLATERVTARLKEKEEEEAAVQRAAAEKARQNMSAKEKKDKKSDEKGKPEAKKSAGTKKATPPMSAKRGTSGAKK